MKAIIYFVVAIIILWAAKFTSPALRVQGYSGLIFSKFWPGYTKYADGYSDEKFLSIKVGMSEAEVLRLLGEPVYRMEDGIGEMRLSYTAACECNYHVRQIYVRYGKVYEIDAYYFFD
jgi:hypothetical protein